MVVDAADETCDVTAFVRANNEALRRIRGMEESHHAVSIIVIVSVAQIINITNILCDYSQVFNTPISLYCEPVSG